MAKKEDNNADKKPFLSRMGNGLTRLMGTGGFTGRVEETMSPWKRAYKENMDRLKKNLEDGEDIESKPFQEVLAAWGIQSPQDLCYYVKSKKQSIGVGAFLFLFGGIGSFFQTKGGILGFLSAFSCVSVAALGAVLMAAGLWRLYVIKCERFVPFEQWLMLPFKGLMRKTSQGKQGKI